MENKLISLGGGGNLSKLPSLKCLYKTYVVGLTAHWGFTLAEVLITLGIIGVVAAITMPTLITKYQKQAALNQLKVAYQIFSEALERAKSDNGGDLPLTPEILAGGTLYGNSPNISQIYFDPYISGVERTYTSKKIDIKNKSQTHSLVVGYTNNTSSLYAPMCTPKGICYWVSQNDPHYIYLFLDINGPKGPNIAGRDVFRANLNYDYAKKMNTGYWAITGMMNFSDLSASRESLKESCSNDKGNTSTWNGSGCLPLIIKDGWIISDDYPW